MQLPLELNVGTSDWAHYAQRAKDPNFNSFAETVYKRDNYTCQYCSFQSHDAMTVVNKNGNYDNKANTLNNMVTACLLCAECHFIEASGKNGAGGGQIIHLPEMTQNDLIGLCHALFYAMALHTTAYNKAESIYNSLKLRSLSLEKNWQEHLSNPNFLGQMLIDTPFADKENTQKKVLSSLRLLPSFEGFAPLVRTWLQSSHTMGGQ